MNLSEKPIYRFADVEVDTFRGCLKCGSEERHLRRKAFEVLVYLLKQDGRLITKEELIKTVWKDMAVTEDALVQCIREIRRAIGDNSQQPRFIKTIPRSGYRFISPVEESSPGPPVLTRTEEITRIEVEFEEDLENDVNPGSRENPGSTPAKFNFIPATRSSRFPASRRSLFATASFALISVLAFAVIFSPRSDVQTAEIVLPPTPGRKPVAVMFFENQSGTTDLDWLREGLADMVITSLSRVESLTVLSRQQLYLSLQRTRRNSADEFQLKDSLDLARRMKVDFVVSGSFARVGEKIRIDARIFDPQRNEISAAESLVVDKPDRILEQVDLLALKLARHLGAPYVGQGGENKLSAAMTNNLEAYRYYSLAVEKAQAYHSLEAIELLKKAIALDPEFAMAYARIGYTYAVIHNNEGAAGKPYLEKAFQLSHRLTEKDHLWIITWYALAHEDMERARRTLRQIITHHPLEVEAYFRLGGFTTDLDEKISVFKQGLAIDPAAYDIWNLLGFAYCHTGRYEEAFAAFRRYIELAPDEANAYDSLGMCYNEAGRFDEALVEFKRALDLNPRFFLTRIHVGDSYLHQGRYQKALEQYRQALEVAPSNWDSAFAYNKLATVYLKKGDSRQAGEAARNELRLKNDLGGSFLVALADGDLNRANKLKAAFLDNSPEFRPLSGAASYRAYFLGRYALKMGRADEALEHFKQLVSSPHQIWNDRWPDCLAEAYLELKRWDDAVREYERLIALNPNFALLHYNLGKAYEQKGQSERARAAYERFLQIWKEADADIPQVIAAKTFIGSV